VLARLWLVLLALLVLAAPARDVVAEAAEVTSCADAADDDSAIRATAVVLDESPPRVVQIPCAAETTRPTPALSRVFRPPRPAFD
jgi:hypothetical protein